jgi:hypothetical protein
VNPKQREALERKAQRWNLSLSAAERAAIRRFTGPGHERMRLLQSGMVEPGSDTDHGLLADAKLAEAACLRAPEVRGRVFRGLRTNLRDESGAAVPLVAGTEWVEGALTSSSLALKVGINFTGRPPTVGPLLIIQSRTGRYIGPAARDEFRHQDEVVFASNIRFRVRDFSESLKFEQRPGRIIERAVILADEVPT